MQGLKLHAAFKLSYILAILQKHSLVTPAVAESVTSFIAANQTFGGGSSTPAAAPATAPTPAAKASRYRSSLVCSRVRLQRLRAAALLTCGVPIALAWSS